MNVEKMRHLLSLIFPPDRIIHVSNRSLPTKPMWSFHIGVGEDEYDTIGPIQDWEVQSVEIFNNELYFLV